MRFRPVLRVHAGTEAWTLNTIAPLLLAFVLGAMVQWRYPVDSARDALWQLYFHVLAPVLVLATFATIQIAADLLLALGAVVIATWLVGALAYAYCVLVTHDRRERGALALTGAFGNTNAVGLPIAQLAFGSPGLELAVIYDRLAWLVPAQSVSTSVARMHSRSASAGAVNLARVFLTNTPLFAMLVGLGISLADIDVPILDSAREVVVAIIGPAAFLLLGLSLPLDRPIHTPEEVQHALGAVVIRVGGGPVTLVAVTQIAAVDVPSVFYLLAGMPSAFHLLTLGRVYDLRPALIGFTITVSTSVVLIIVGMGLAIR
jgi:predicted permease